MKKIYPIFFLLILFAPLVGLGDLTAQQKPIIAPQVGLGDKNQQFQNAIKPQVKEAQAPQTKEPVATKKPAVTGSRHGKPTPKRRIRHNPTTYGNEWIQYDQYYYKIKVAENGIYRIDSLALAKAGIPVDTINGSHYQIYFRGVQQYIYVRSRTTNLSEKNGDYIEFYGQANDGVPDSTLYYRIKFLPNPYYSLFNDTSTYYLTWGGAGDRMTVPRLDTLWGSYKASPYVMASTVYAENSQYSQGTWQPDGGFTPNDPRFTQNSAWTNPWIGYGSNAAYTLNYNSPYTGAGAPSAFLRTVVLGVNNGNSLITITASTIPPYSYTNIPFNTAIVNGNNVFRAMDTTMVFSASTLPPSSFSLAFYNNLGSNTNIIAPTYVYLNYPHKLDLAGASTFMMSVPYVGSGKTYLDFNTFSTSTPADSVRMYDLNNHTRFWVKPEGGGFKVNVPTSPGTLEECYLTSDSAINKVRSLMPVGTASNGGIGNGLFTNFSAGGDSAFIIITHPTLWNEGLAYESYRSTYVPRHYNTVLANVEELYDQFGYGIRYSPLGIKRFCNYAIDKWASPPSNLFLMGKAIHTPLMRPDTAVWSRAQMLVPSYGYPSSDILFTNTLWGIDSLLEPAIPTGRLAAASADEVATYLSKVEVYESAPAALWMKNIAHFAGGNSAIEEAGFRNYLDAFASYVTDTLFGANIYLFQKSTPNPITGTLTDSILNLVNNGVSIMTFFGHAGGSNWDESVDYPTEYSNYNKYPFMIGDACFSGDIYQALGHGISSVSEQWVLNGPGAIGFLASDYLGDAGALDSYTQKLYDNIGHTPFYRKPMGQIIQNTIDTWQASSDIFMTFTCLEMTLHGDPAITINAMDSLPDYAVNNQSVYFTPSRVTIFQDSFDVHVIVYNYGEAVDTGVSMVLTRTFPNGLAENYPRFITPPKYPYLYYADTITIKVPVNGSGGALGQGLNTFNVSVDLTSPGPYKELTYANNTLGSPVLLWITSEDITPVWPYDYAIIPKDTVTLKASTDDPFAPQRRYIFEIDTSHGFNSPVFRSDTVTNSGGVIMISPYANWGTTHFKAPFENRNSGSGNKMTVNANRTTQNNLVSAQHTAISAQNTISEKAAGTQLSSPIKGKIPVQQSPGTTGTKPGVQAVASGQMKSAELQKNNSAIGKLHKPHGPIMDSFIPNAVYYWRVRRDTADSVAYPWVMSSFQYIKGKNGWGQSDYYQYNNDEIFNDNYYYINFVNSKRDWVFNTAGSTLQCNTYGMKDICGPCLNSTGYTINNWTQTPSAGCQFNPGIYIAVIDKTTLQPWSTADHRGIGNANPPNGPCGIALYFAFWEADSLQMHSLVRMLRDSVPAGDYILAYTWYEGAFKYSSGLAYADSVIPEFTSLGATQMHYHATTPGLDSVPWIFFVQKGIAGTAKQVYGTTSVTPIDGPGIQLSVILSSNGTYGAISTPLIGPAAKYDSLSWFQHPDELPLKDSTRLNIIGVQPNGSTKVLEAGITPTVANMLISSINPVLFPYIQLQLYTKDGLKRTPAQMNWWRVFYQPVPEIAMNPNVYTYYHADTLEYGDKLNFQTTVQNISDWPISSTQLLTWISNQNNSVTYYNQGQMVKALNPGDTAKISFVYTDSSSNMNLNKSVWFEVNPEAYPDTRLEQYHFNNYAEKSFFSYGDKINPVLDVTFDGIHILNNDIVSAQPNILVTFTDENKFLALNNANNFKVYLNPLGSPPQLQTYGPKLTFTPAVLPHNKCNLLLTPTLADGTYQLTVQGTDISGNLSANNSYMVDFQVINKPMITQVLNYPNPFSTSTRFVFILTGEQIPTTFKIQIMTVSGKIVKEITEDEIGPIHIGRNITQYAWDGTDQYGSKLANGVYLYRVITSINGQGIDEYQQGYDGANIDKYFTKGWGKMFLMR